MKKDDATYQTAKAAVKAATETASVEAAMVAILRKRIISQRVWKPPLRRERQILGEKDLLLPPLLEYAAKLVLCVLN